MHKDLPIVLRYEKSAKQCISDYAQQWEKARRKDLSFSNAMSAYNRVSSSYKAKQKQKEQTVETRNRIDEVEQMVCVIRDK